MLRIIIRADKRRSWRGREREKSKQIVNPHTLTVSQSVSHTHIQQHVFKVHQLKWPCESFAWNNNNIAFAIYNNFFLISLIDVSLLVCVCVCLWLVNFSIWKIPQSNLWAGIGIDTNRNWYRTLEEFYMAAHKSLRQVFFSPLNRTKWFVCYPLSFERCHTWKWICEFISKRSSWGAILFAPANTLLIRIDYFFWVFFYLRWFAIVHGSNTHF